MASKVPHGHLPPELIFDILLRLPVKSLLRFMCVSKSWNSLISSPEFIKTHLKETSNARNTAHRKLIFSSFYGVPVLDFVTECNLDCVLYSPTIEATDIVTHIVASSMTEATKIQHPAKKSIDIVGSCNGLVCIAMEHIFNPFASDSIRDLCLFLWNPSIRKYRKLPQCSFGFDFEKSDVAACGFGYDELHDDYKFIAFLRVHSPEKIAEDQVVEICSQRTNSWKTKEVFKKYSFRPFQGGYVVDGKLHWSGTFHHEEEDDYPSYKIVSFDLADETYGEIELPENYKGKSNALRWSIGVLGEGRLAFFWLHIPDLDVWIMTDYGATQSWTKMCSIRYPKDLQCRLGFHLNVHLVFLSERGELLLKVKSLLLLYNLEDGAYKILKVRSKLRGIRGLLKVDVYYESLALLDAHDG
nr:F-box/kelch-repeat protein At3g23880-like [Coffea arabica]